MSLSSLNRRPEEDKFDETIEEKKLAASKEIQRLDTKMGITDETNNDNVGNKCLYCKQRGYKNMNRHFCSPDCATTYYWANRNNNPYKPNGGKTKSKRTKRTKTSKRSKRSKRTKRTKNYRKQ